MRSVTTVLIGLLLAALVACSGSPAALPPAADVLQQSSQAMGGVTSAHYVLEASGDPSGLPISSSDGVLARGGQVQGNLVIGGAEYPFRVTGGIFYIKAGTSWVHAPTPFDPSTFLDPSQGLASLLGRATGGRVLKTESVGGVQAYRVEATVPTDLVKGLADLAPGQDTLPATLWIATSGSRLLRFRIPFRHDGSSADTIVTGTLSAFNTPVNVQPPA